MPTLPLSMIPPAFAAVLARFAPHFSARVWCHALVLLAGALLTPARRTVTAALRVLGLGELRQYHRYHRVLSHARWSGLAVSRILAQLLVATFAPTGPLVFGIDETLERRWGQRIAAKGSYRDPVRSSRSHFVKASGLRWVGAMLLVPIPWAARAWALPVLTALAPSERYNRQHGRRHKTLTDWALQLLRTLQRWWPDRDLVAVADSTYAAIEFLSRCQAGRRPVTVVTRLRLDAARSEPAPPRDPQRRGRPRRKGSRLPTLAARLVDSATRWRRVTVPQWYGRGPRDVAVASATAVWYHSGLPPVPLRWVLIRDPRGGFAPQALLCTQPAVAPEQILAWFVQRWQLEVTFAETRRHLGLETQRHWSDAAIRRTTPALLGLFSLVTLLAHERWPATTDAVRPTAWYQKVQPTFVDALALVRRELWRQQLFQLSSASPDPTKSSAVLVEHLTDVLCYAA